MRKKIEHKIKQREESKSGELRVAVTLLTGLIVKPNIYIVINVPVTCTLRVPLNF